jgi:hypothetical protein
MKIALVAVALLVACLMAEGSSAQSSSRFQSVGDDYGENLIGTLRTTDSEPASASNKSGLWSWGSSPKGTTILDGGLAGDPKYSMKKLNVVDNWLGDILMDSYGSSPAYSYTDPDTGAPVKAYVDPYTGQYYYISTDSKSKKPVYVYFDPETGVPFYATFSPPLGTSPEINGGAYSGPYAGTSAGPNGMTLPPVFSSNDPWSQGL